MAPCKKTSPRPAGTPKRIMTRPSAFRKTDPATTTTPSIPPLSTIDEDTEESTPSPSAVKAKTSRKAPAKPRPTPSKAKATPGTKASGSRRKLPSADKAYKDDSSSGEETEAVPKLTSVAGTKRKVTFQATVETETDEEGIAESSASGQQRRPTKRKSKAIKDPTYRPGKDDEADLPDEFDDLIEDDEIMQSVEGAGNAETIVTTRKTVSPLAFPSPKATMQGSPIFQSQEATDRGPKRQRTRSPSVSPRSNPDNSTPSATNDQADSDPITAARELFSKIEKAPGPLQHEEISALFMVLQEDISTFCKGYFSFDLTPQQQQAWPLHELATKYKPLLKVTQYVADGCSSGWRSFFTENQHRRHLVHAILGDWFTNHIFKQPAFGVRASLLNDLEDVDREYLGYDGFVRTKKRTAIMENARLGDVADRPIQGRFALMEDNLGYFPASAEDGEFESFSPDYEKDVGLATCELTKSIMEVLEPLLPPPCFDPLVSRQRQSKSQRDDADEWRNDIYLDLHDLIKRAAALHHSIRFSGKKGLVVAIAPHVKKGELFTIDDSNRNICVNAADLNDNVFRPKGPNAQLAVKMTCFGRVQATMPHGMDLEELEREQAASAAAGKTLTREEAERKLFPKLPYELQKPGAGRNAVAHMDPIPGTEWNNALHRENLDNNVQRGYDRDTTPDMQAQPERHPFVTIYPRIAPSNLYCEWADLAEMPGEFPRTADVNTQSLEDAVLEAIRNAPIAHRLKTAWQGLPKRYIVEWALMIGIVTSFTGTASREVYYALYSPTTKSLGSNSLDGAKQARWAVSSLAADASSYLSKALASNAAAISSVAASLSALRAPTTIESTTTRTATRIGVEDSPSAFTNVGNMRMIDDGSTSDQTRTVVVVVNDPSTDMTNSDTAMDLDEPTTSDAGLDPTPLATKQTLDTDVLCSNLISQKVVKGPTCNEFMSYIPLSEQTPTPEPAPTPVECTKPVPTKGVFRKI